MKPQNRERQKLKAELHALNAELVATRTEVKRAAASSIEVSENLKHIGEKLAGLKGKLTKLAAARARGKA